MLTFIVGVLAALLWIGTVFGLYLLLKTSPRHPFRTIRQFRVARRRLSTPTEPLVELVTPDPPQQQIHDPVYVEDQPAPEPPPPTPAVLQPKLSGGAVDRYIAQVKWLEPEVLHPEIIQIPEAEKTPARRISPPRRTPPETHPRAEQKAAPKRMAVVLVDEEGKPQL